MNKQFKSYIPFLPLVLGIIATAMIFLPALKYSEMDTTYTGLQVVTGVSVLNLGILGEGHLPFNILALLAFTLPLAAGIVGLTVKKSFYISTVLFVIAAFLLFVLPQYTNISYTVLGGETAQLEVEWVMQAGLIIAGSLSIIGAVVSLLGFSK